MKKLLVMMVVFACILAAVPLAASTTVFSNFGPGNSYSNAGAWFVVDNPGFSQMVACQFTPSVNCTLDGIDFEAYWATGNTSVSAELLSDSSGLPGGVLESYTVSGLTSTPQLLTASSTSHPTLTAGQTYWFDLMGNGSFCEWDFNSTDNSTGSAFRYTSADPWQASTAYPAGAFRVNGTPTSVVPEPSSLLASLTLLIGVVPFATIKRRRRVSAE